MAAVSLTPFVAAQERTTCPVGTTLVERFDAVVGEPGTALPGTNVNLVIVESDDSTGAATAITFQSNGTLISVVLANPGQDSQAREDFDPPTLVGDFAAPGGISVLLFCTGTTTTETETETNTETETPTEPNPPAELPDTGAIGDQPGASASTWALLAAVTAGALGLVGLWTLRTRRNR